MVVVASSLALGIAAHGAGAVTNAGVAYAVAGVPVDQGSQRDYDAIFANLKANGVSIFFPTFLYQQAPVAKSLGFESDFAPPCTKSDPAFKALRASGLGLVLPASILYSPDRALPPLAKDPLAAVIGCAGPGVVKGVMSYDEPAHAKVPESAVAALYARVKKVNPSLPVMMVHAPMTTDTSPAEHDVYMQAVQAMSVHADVVGFDIYPVPEFIAKIVRPGTGTEVLDTGDAVAAYSALARQLAPQKRYLAVLQNFAYADQFSPEMLTTFPPEVVAAAIGPTQAEMVAMATAAESGGAEVIVWFGGAYTPSSTAPQWQATLAVTQLMESQ